VDGANMPCQSCHQTKHHQIPGQAMSVSTGAGKRVECGGCHNTKPHNRSTLNQHILSVACQTCHIPSFAKDQPTKIWADWSSAGADRMPEKDQYGMDLYVKNKGEMRWGKTSHLFMHGTTAVQIATSLAIRLIPINLFICPALLARSKTRTLKSFRSK